MSDYNGQESVARGDSGGQDTVQSKTRAKVLNAFCGKNVRAKILINL